MTPNLFALVVALIAVESGGNDAALSPDHSAVGCLQITPGVIDDVNRFQGLFVFTRTDCLYRSRSFVIFWIYVSHYAKASRLGHEPTLRDIALIWHYGPARAKGTDDPDGYWNRVEALVR